MYCSVFQLESICSSWDGLQFPLKIGPYTCVICILSKYEVLLVIRVAPDTDWAGYPANIFTGYPVWPDIRYPAGYPAK